VQEQKVRMTSESKLLDTIVICSTPVDDDIEAAKYNGERRNLSEWDWDILTSELTDYPNVVLVNNSTEVDDLKRMYIFAKQNNLEVNFKNSTWGDKDISFYASHADIKTISDNEILFIGCSHTAGEGHSSPETVYPHMLSEQLNLIPVVDAHAGKGNYLTEEKLNIYDLKNKKVIVQFTGIDRLWLNGQNTVGYHYTKGMVDVFSDTVLVSNYYAQIQRITNYLRSQQAQFLFFQLSGEYPYELEVNALCSNFREFVYMTNYNVDDGDLGHHYGVKSHSLVSNLLYKKWIRLYDRGYAKI